MEDWQIELQRCFDDPEYFRRNYYRGNSRPEAITPDVALAPKILKQYVHDPNFISWKEALSPAIGGKVYEVTMKSIITAQGYFTHDNRHILFDRYSFLIREPNP